MSFLPSLSPGNVKGKLPSDWKFDDDLRWIRPTEWLSLGTSTYDGTVPEKIIGLVAVYPDDIHNYVSLHLDTNDSSNITVNWGDGNPAETEHESDFSSDVNGYAHSSHGSVSRVASHNGEADVLLYQSSGGRDGIRNTNVDLLTGNAYTLTFDYYADSSFSGVWGVEYSYANRISIANNFPTIVTGAWTSVSLTIPATRPATNSIEYLQIRPQADANSVYANNATSGQIGFKNIKVIRNASSSGYYVKHNLNFFHSYDYDAITSDTSTAKSTPFRGYKQVKFEVTLTGTAKLSQINFDVEGPFTTHTSRLYRRGANILDLFASTSLATNVEISDSRPLKICEQIEVRNTSSNRLTNPGRLYNGAQALESIPFVPWIYNSGTRDYLYAFYYNQSLLQLPDDFADPDRYWFKNPSRVQEAFRGCMSLRYIPNGLFGTTTWASCNNFYLMFWDCRKLANIPYLPMRTGAGTDTRCDYMFYNCMELRAIPQGFSVERANTNGIDRLFHGCRSCTDWSVLYDGGVAILDNLNISAGSTFNMSQSFSNLDQLLEFPYVGNFSKHKGEAYAVFNGANSMKRFNSQYTHLDFTGADGLKQCFQELTNIQEIPEIRVRSLTRDNALHYTFYNCNNLRNIKMTGMIAGAGNGEYHRCFYNNRSLAVIDGIDFSFATETSDYYQMFHVCRDIGAIRFPGTFRAGYASPRINVAVANHSDISGEYIITAAGTGYTQSGGDGVLEIEDQGDGTLKWVVLDSNDDDPQIKSAAFSSSSGVRFTPWAADFSAETTNTVTFSEVETGFKYTVTGGSGDGLRYCPINRANMLEIFNQLVTVSHSATLDIRNNSYTADLTDADKAIATNKGWTLTLA